MVLQLCAVLDVCLFRLLLKVDCLANAVGKQPSITDDDDETKPFHDITRKFSPSFVVHFAPTTSIVHK